MTPRIFHGDDAASLRAFLEVDRRRREKDREELIKLVKHPPLSPETLSKLVWLGHKDWVIVTHHHPGREIDELETSLRNMVDVFVRCWVDLSRHLDQFTTSAAHKDFMGRPKRSELREIQTGVRKELFAISTASKALVDLSRRLTRKVSIPGWRDRISQDFSSDPTHHLVLQLRNTLTHGWFVPANWLIRRSPEGESATFTLSRSEMLRSGDFSGVARDYLLAVKENIDVRKLFEPYVAKVRSLYSWLWENLEDHLDPAVIEFRHCASQRQKNSVRTSWNLILQAVSNQEIDPYDYLEKYLTADELAEVLKLPHRSIQQVDKILSILDEYNACDDDLRKKIFHLFNVSSQPNS